MGCIRMGRKKENFHLMIIMAFISIIAVAYFLTQDYAITDLGFDAQIATDLMSVAPGIFLFLISITIVSQIDSGHPALVGGFACMGLGVVFLVQELYTIEIITDAMINPATILQIQELIFIISILLGGYAWASSKR